MKTLKKIFPILFICLVMINLGCNKKTNVDSPNGELKVQVQLSEKGELLYSVLFKNQQVLKPSKLGLKLSHTVFDTSLVITGVEKRKGIKDTYTLLTGKKKICTYEANEMVITVKNTFDASIKVKFRVSNDGVAFCYYIPDDTISLAKIENEYTSFHFALETKAWLHPHADARTGWNATQPSYEEHYYSEVPVGTPAPFAAGWSFPALFNYKDCWILITESNVQANYCGSRLASASSDGKYSIAFPQPLETTDEKLPTYPESSLPWTTPWRVLIIGNLSTIVESTLVTNVADPDISTDTSFIKPGYSSWSWVLLKDDSTVFDVQKRFIDFAAKMKWRYCLIDAFWDKQIGYNKIQELVNYAQTKGVKIILWYNSAGSWNTTPLTPRDLMYDKIARRNEFEKISKMGVAGIKVDFFGGDGQSMMAYYHDLFKDALEYRLLVNCHGATIPRGWNRTYPNLMTMESVRGFEYVTFDQLNADKQAWHCTILPFTRNTIGPMDFTPTAFSEVPNIQRKTSNAFELATAILFQSGIQHYAEIPKGMAQQPDYVVQLLSSLPEVWEDIKFIEGYPSKYVVLARKGNNKWYVAGINAHEQVQTINLKLTNITKKPKTTVITDGDSDRMFRKYETNETELNVSLKPNGGFVAIVE